MTHRHNKTPDAVGDLDSLMWNPVRCEPIVKEAGDDEQGTLIADLAIRGVWQLQCADIFDIRVVDTDPLSYCSCAIQECLTNIRDGQEAQVLKGLPG